MRLRVLSVVWRVQEGEVDKGRTEWWGRSKSRVVGVGSKSSSGVKELWVYEVRVGDTRLEEVDVTMEWFIRRGRLGRMKGGHGGL